MEICRMEAANQQSEEKTKSREQVWEQKQAEKEQVGQRAVYLDSGVTFDKYKEAY